MVVRASAMVGQGFDHAKAAAVLGISPPQAMHRLTKAGVAEAAAYDQVRTKLYRRRDLDACRSTADAA